MAQRQWRSDDTDIWSYGFGNGSDGDLTISSNTTFSTANAGCSGSSGATALTLDNASAFSNGELVLIHQSRGTGVGNWELNKISSGAGTTSLVMVHNLTNDYANSGSSQAQIVKLAQYSNVTVNSGQTWSAPDWDGNKGGIIAFLCSGNTTFTGQFSLNADGYVGGSGSSGQAQAGEGTTGAATAQEAANGNGGGGGKLANGRWGGGGGGGNGTAGTSGEESPEGQGGAGGSTAGNAELTSIVFGGSGGGGNAQSGTPGTGGDGAGLAIIMSKNITISGSPTATGANGTTDGTGGGGGGGGGGSILIKAETATLGSNKITANGGTGGQPSDTSRNGGNGGSGRIHLDYSNSYTGTTTPTIDARQDTTIVTPSVAAGNPVFFSLGVGVG